MKLNKARPPLILTNSVVFLFVYNGDGQTKITLGRGAYHSNTAKRENNNYTPALMGDYRLTVRRS